MDEHKPQAPDFEGEKMKMPESALDHGITIDAKERSPMGFIIAILVVLLVAILAGLYLWYNSIITQSQQTPVPAATRPTAEENNEPESPTAKAQTDSFNVVSTSDELSAIEADVESTDLESLDTEMEAIDAELDAALNAQ